MVFELVTFFPPSYFWKASYSTSNREMGDVKRGTLKPIREHVLTSRTLILPPYFLQGWPESEGNLGAATYKYKGNSRRMMTLRLVRLLDSFMQTVEEMGKNSTKCSGSSCRSRRLWWLMMPSMDIRTYFVLKIF